jgi:hypothetical protein
VWDNTVVVMVGGIEGAWILRQVIVRYILCSSLCLCARRAQNGNALRNEAVTGVSHSAARAYLPRELGGGQGEPNPRLQEHECSATLHDSAELFMRRVQEKDL